MLSATEKADLEEFVAALRKDYKKLSVRIRTLTQSIACEVKGVTIRLHFPTVSQGNAKIPELIDSLLNYMTPFALPRSYTDPIAAEYGKIPEEDYRVKREKLQREAIDLFIKANKATNRNGEAGELLLYLLTEWILETPQLISKLSLKTNPNAPVLGSDGVHVSYSAAKKALIFYCGESKLYHDVGKAIADAASSIAKALTADSAKHELQLISRNIGLAGATPAQTKLLLSYLDPNDDDENYNKRIDISTCLIGFDFNAFNQLTIDCGDDEFAALAEAELRKITPKLATAIKQAGLKNRLIEIFFFPVPSVQVFRDLFQAKVGWNK